MAFARFARDMGCDRRNSSVWGDSGDRLDSGVWGDLGGERWPLANRVNAIDPYGIHRCFNYPTLNTNPFKY